jgi:hypothetical protein
MGVNYSVIPVTDEPEFTDLFRRWEMQSPEDEAIEPRQGPLADAIRQQRVSQWLKTYGIDYAVIEHNGRYPSMTEILAALNSADYVTPKQYKNSGDIIITNDFTDETSLLHLWNYSGNPDEPHNIWFEKGAPLTIIHASIVLSRVCGPLIVIPDYNDIPILARPHEDELELLKAWDGF